MDSHVSDSDTEGGPPALKERAGVVNALLDGAQTVLVRAADLPPCGYEEPFVLYPGYSHQDPTRYSRSHERYYHTSTSKPDAGIPVRATATVVEEHPIDRGDLEALAPHYAYTAEGLREKYRFGDTDARLLVLRVSTVEAPRLLEERSAYRGCRTWIELDDELEFEPATPVLDDAEFAERVAAIRSSIS